MLHECRIVILHIGAHVKVDVAAAIQDVSLGVVGQGVWLDGGGGELEKDDNKEKAARSKHSLNSGIHLAKQRVLFLNIPN